MSFSSDVKDELGGLSIKPPACRRAYLYGLLYGAAVEGDTVTATFSVHPCAAYDPATHAVSLIHALFSRTATTRSFTRGAHRYTEVSFSYRQAAKHLSHLSTLPEEEAAAETIPAVLEWNGDEQVVHFLRGLFVSFGTINDPDKSFRLEIKLPTDGRMEPVHILLCEHGYEPSVTRRGEAYGLFFRNADTIQEFLGYLGSTSLLFRFYNTQIERDIRNNENRATNFVTENIGRSMRAGSKQTSAMLHLDELGLLPSLSDDLRETARLRLENPEATLPELAAMHTPAITKSGVYHRLQKIMAFYEKIMAAGHGTSLDATHE